MIMKASLSILGATIAFSAATATAQNLETVTTPGAHIQRTMSLLATSTPEKRNAVRVLFYGQSITCQGWWRQVADDLKKRFPNADLKIENRGIGGFTAPNLVKTTVYDVFPVYPDLLIFHVYGGGQMDKWEEIVRLARTKTAAEVLLWTHHDSGHKGHIPESERIREIAVKYNCGLVDVLAQWQAILKEKNLEPKAYLKDSVHLNEEGCKLLASMIKPFLVYKPELMTDESRGLVSEIDVTDSSRVKKLADGSIEVTFTGNRIDAVALPSAGTDPIATVTLDGTSPIKVNGTCALTRPSSAPYTWFPAVTTITHNVPLVPEDWLLEFTSFTPDASKFTYKVTGSVTGEDGEGSKDELFTSKSGRVVIEGGQNWHRVPWSLTYKKKQMPETFSVKWKVYPMFVDELKFAAAKDPASERAVTLAKGFANSEHTVRLTPKDGARIDIKSFRVYHPALKMDQE